MQNRWTPEADALRGLDALVHQSRLLGADPQLVLRGGGNTSIKQTERDHRGREVRVLRVKGSGSDLKTIQKKDFPGVRMDDVLALVERQDMGDSEMVDYLRFALQDPEHGEAHRHQRRLGILGKDELALRPLEHEP